MKFFKHKKLVLTLAACAVIAAGIGGTYAVLTASTNNVTNTFKPEVIETKIEETWTKDAFDKTVSIKNVGKDDAFIRARVTVSPDNVATWKSLGEDGWQDKAADGWEFKVGKDGEEGWYYYTEVVQPGENTTPLMNAVEVPEGFEGDFDVTVYQEAVGTGSYTKDSGYVSADKIKPFFDAIEK